MLQSYDAAVRPKVRQHPSDIRFVFEWRDEYSVGVGSIDAQHRTLFGLAAELWEAIAAGRGKSACNKTLDRLVLYTATHFAHEQRLMELYHYSGFAEHKAEHDALTQQVLKFQSDFRAGATITIQLLQFMKSWLERHIKTADLQFAPFLISRRVA